jgi:hypothetical protein
MRMHVSSPKVPNARAMQMHAQEGAYLFIYFSKGGEQDQDDRLMIESSRNRTRISILRIS